MKYLEQDSFNLTNENPELSSHKPRVLMLYGSLRETSYSRIAAEEAGRILEHMGAEVKFFNPKGLPLFDNGDSADHPKVQELRELIQWSEAQVWSSPEILPSEIIFLKLLNSSSVSLAGVCNKSDRSSSCCFWPSRSCRSPSSSRWANRSALHGRWQ